MKCLIAPIYYFNDVSRDGFPSPASIIRPSSKCKRHIAQGSDGKLAVLGDGHLHPRGRTGDIYTFIRGTSKRKSTFFTNEGDGPQKQTWLVFGLIFLCQVANVKVRRRRLGENVARMSKSISDHTFHEQNDESGRVGRDLHSGFGNGTESSEIVAIRSVL